MKKFLLSALVLLLAIVGSFYGHYYLSTENIFKIMDMNWHKSLNEIAKEFPRGVFKRGVPKNRVVGHYEFDLFLFGFKSKIIFYDFDPSRKWADEPMRRVAVKVNNDFIRNWLTQRIVKNIYRKYDSFTIMKGHNNLKNELYNLHIEQFFGVKKGLSIMFSKAGFENKDLYITMAPYVILAE